MAERWVRAYTVGARRLDLRPCSPRRDWMDATPGRFAYRCLPLSIANSFGWEICLEDAVTVTWNGGSRLADLRIDVDGRNLGFQPMSHFGEGIVTFPTSYLFRTPPGVALQVAGPANLPLDGVAPLTGLVETSWSPYSFTMNWMMTRPGAVRFPAGFPFCRITPVMPALVAEAEASLVSIDDDPAVKAEFNAWRKGRMESLEAPRDAHGIPPWEKRYFRGLLPDGNPTEEQHLTRLRPAEFTEDD